MTENWLSSTSECFEEAEVAQGSAHVLSMCEGYFYITQFQVETPINMDLITKTSYARSSVRQSAEACTLEGRANCPPLQRRTSPQTICDGHTP